MPAPGRLPPLMRIALFTGLPLPAAVALKLDGLTNPIWSRTDYNVRDPAVLPVEGGYVLFYSRFAGKKWGDRNNWSVAKVFTGDWTTFSDPQEITPKGYASPGDPVQWHGRILLPDQSYLAHPPHFFYSESKDGRTWSALRVFLPEANRLPWNELGRAIDPSFVVDGHALHCFFVGSKRLAGGGHANLLGHAITQDPKLEKWDILTKEKPLIGVSERAPDGVENVMVYKTGPHWTMLCSEGMAKQDLAYAESPDLVGWTLKTPVDIPRQSWMRLGYGAPFVWREPDRWMMILMGETSNRKTRFGLLHSTDGIEWTILPERQP